jgi:hypothetical protein
MNLGTFSAVYFFVCLIFVVFMMYRLISGIDWKNRKVDESTGKTTGKNNDTIVGATASSDNATTTTDSGSSADG